MGAGIAAVAAMQGIPVRFKDMKHEQVGRGLAAVRAVLQERLTKKQITRQAICDDQLSLVSGTIEYTGFAHVPLVIEAVFEDLAVKHQVLARGRKRFCRRRRFSCEQHEHAPDHANRGWIRRDPDRCHRHAFFLARAEDAAAQSDRHAAHRAGSSRHDSCVRPQARQNDLHRGERRAGILRESHYNAVYQRSGAHRSTTKVRSDQEVIDKAMLDFEVSGRADHAA